MNATLERPAMKPARPVSIKAALVAQIQAAIEAAPQDSAEVARLRKRHPVCRVKPGESRTTVEKNHYNAWRGATYDTEAQLKSEAVEKITFTAGPVSYTVWNTRETLEGFLSRVKRAFP